jgi:acetyl esterase/lipase
MMKPGCPGGRDFLLLGLLPGVTPLQAQSDAGVSVARSPSAANNWNGMPPAKVKEYQDNVAIRTSWISKLPPGTVMVLFSPVYLIHAGIPPILIEHGDKDTTAPLVQSQMFYGALKKAGFDVTLTHYPDYTHNLWHPDVFMAELAFFQKAFAAVR